MKWYWRLLSYVAVFAAGAGFGFAFEWWNSPLGEPFCVAQGSVLVAMVVREWSYWIGWGVIALACLVVMAVPLYGIWLKKVRP